MPATPREPRRAWMVAALVALVISPAAAQTSDGITTGTISTPNKSAFPRRLPVNLPPPGPPPVQLAMTPYNPALHQLTWNWDGVHGVSYYQVYKLDPQSPGGRLVVDRLSYRSFWDSTFVA